jgi:hypothetical protein
LIGVDRMNWTFALDQQQIFRQCSKRQTNPFEQRGVALVASQGIQQRVPFHLRKSTVALPVGAIEPLESAVRFAAKRIGLGDLISAILLEFGDQFRQVGVRFFFLPEGMIRQFVWTRPFGECSAMPCSPR